MTEKTFKRRLIATEELFDAVMKELEKTGDVPDIIDYALAARDSRPIRDCEFDVLGTVSYGGSEGIYVDLFYKGDIGTGYEQHGLGTIKTLESSDEAFLRMANLMAKFQLKAYKFINDNYDDLVHTGFESYCCRKDDPNPVYGTVFKRSSENEVRRAVAREFQRANYDYAVIRDNRSGIERTYDAEEVAGWMQV